MKQLDNDLEDLFHQRLKHMWYGEKKIHTCLPKMANAADADALRAAFKKHETETERQIARLGELFEMIKKPAKGEPSVVIDGLIDECMEFMVNFKELSAFDAGLIAGAQAIKHYEISCYGTLRAWAEQLGMQKAVSLLDESLTEEKDADEALTELAEDIANPVAQEGDKPRKERAKAQA